MTNWQICLMQPKVVVSQANLKCFMWYWAHLLYFYMLYTVETTMGSFGLFLRKWLDKPEINVTHSILNTFGSLGVQWARNFE